MKILLAFVTLVTYGGCVNVFAQQQFVTLEDIQAQYKSLSEIKPVLVNAGDRPIYLLQKECGEAQLTFIGGEYWEWSHARECPEFEPVEIKPGGRYPLPSPVMRGEEDEGKFRDDRDGPPGKYIIAISYSLRPSYVAGKPELGHSLSKRFTIIR